MEKEDIIAYFSPPKRTFLKHEITNNCALITTHVFLNIKFESHRVRVKVRELVRQLES